MIYKNITTEKKNQWLKIICAHMRIFKSNNYDDNSSLACYNLFIFKIKLIIKHNMN